MSAANVANQRLDSWAIALEPAQGDADQLAALGHGSLGIERQGGVDLGRHAAWHEFQDFGAEGDQQAVDYFRANSSVPDAAIKSEVQRYLVMPGQATAYKIGMIKIQQLRKKAETELGEQFDIRGFHDAILGGGAMPLDLVERRVDRWIAGKKAG